MKHPKILSTKSVAASRIFQIETVDLEFSNGELRTYECFYSQGYKQGAVMIVPIATDGQFVMVREYAAGIERYELSFPKGMIDAGETPEQAALRELQEEVGFAAHELTLLKTVATSPGYMRNTIHIFLARELYPSQLLGDEPEPLEVVTWPIADYQILLQQSTFSGASNISALFLALEKLDELN